jgi:hypothetical protein
MDAETIYGVDFSGASKAGEKIWVATGEPVGDNRLRIHEVQRAAEFLEIDSHDRNEVLPALLRRILDSDESDVFGLDFPFSLPKKLLSQTDWTQFVREFPDEFLSPANLQQVCSDRAMLVTDGDAKQINRETEKESAALCPYNLQISKQTFYGIRDILRPLVLTQGANIPPMIAGESGVPRVVEVYPAGTLDDLGLPDSGYKSSDAADKREEILDQLVAETDNIQRERLIEDDEADGIDSIVAAMAVARNADELESDDTEKGKPVSGRIYV